MKRSLLLVPIVLFTTVAFYQAPKPRAEDTGEAYIIPWKIPFDESGNRVITVNQNQPVVLGARWGTCTRGLGQAWPNHANLYYEIDGSPLLPDVRDGRAFWTAPEPSPLWDPTPCIPHTDTVWGIFWRYPIGTLTLGSHEGYLRLWIDHQVVDGGDFVDGDGLIDHYRGVLFEGTFTIVVK